MQSGSNAVYGGWNDERVFDLKALVEEGCSAGIIAEKLSEKYGEPLSRNAVIGKLHRLGVKRSAVEVRTSKRGIRPAKRSPVVNLMTKLAAKQERRSGKVVPFRTKVFSGPSLDLTFDQLTRDTCKFERSRSDIVSEFRFCGQPVKSGKPYCEHCCQIAYVAVQRGAAA